MTSFFLRIRHTKKTTKLLRRIYLVGTVETSLLALMTGSFKKNLQESINRLISRRMQENNDLKKENAQRIT
jgi:hypothetical protein